MKTFASSTLALLLMLPTGCEKPNVETVAAAVADAEETEASSMSTKRAMDETPSDNRIDMSGVANEPPPITSTPREFTHKDAKFGKKARQAGGYLGAVTSKIPYAENQMFINQMKQAMEIYRAQNDGKYPKTHEEFVENVIKANNLRMPPLEDGDEYIYDPEDHLLKVYRPEG